MIAHGSDMQILTVSFEIAVIFCCDFAVIFRVLGSMIFHFSAEFSGSS